MMKRKTLLSKVMLLLCILTAGVSNAWGEQKTLTFVQTSTSAGTLTGAPTGVTASFSNTYTTKDQLTSGKTMTLTLSGWATTTTITGVTLEVRNNKSSGSGTATVKIGETTLGTLSISGLGNTYQEKEVSITPTKTSSDLVITISASANSVFCDKFIVEYQEASEYPLASISLSGTYPTTFTEKDEFSHEGMVVTAHYTGTDATEIVTSDATFSGYNMETIGKQTVTVSYTEGDVTKDATYEINVNEGTKYTLTFDAGAGTCATTSLTQSEYRGTIVLPTATIDIDGWTFAGWALESVSNTSTRPTLYAGGSTIRPNSTRTVYAVYKTTDYDITKFVRATSVSDVTSAPALVVVYGSTVLNHELENGVTAPTETSSMISPESDQIFTLSGNNTTGLTLTGGASTIGAGTLPTSGNRVLALTSSNNKWIVEENTSGTNLFVLRNANSDYACIQYYSSDWKVYYHTSYASQSSLALKLYVPASAYNSNPTSAVVTPTVAYSDHTTPTLYLDGTSTHTRTATLTGIDKTLTYASSDEDVATVSSEGVVTAVGIGTATITASVAAELGVNKYASDTYDVVVKNTTTIAGIKAITDASSAVAFAADLTDAVVTYVNGTHAYIQDASGAIYASCGSSLTAGDKINGAISGSVKAANKIDEITVIDLSDATVTDDGVIPAAELKTLAQIKAGDYDGKLVTVNGATVKTAMNNATSGGVITDDGEETTFNIIAPNRLTLKATEGGNFTGFVSIFNGTAYRLNLYEESQFVKTRNAETAQPLSFTEDAIELDEETSELTSFTGQTVSGAQGTVTYAFTGDPIGEVNASTGAVTLNGARGTATITATAAAKEVTEAGVTTPYTETVKSYTITVRPRYTVTFSVNGVETELREASFGAGVAVPANPSAVGDYKFQGWSTATVAKTDIKPALASIEAGDNYVPADDETIYAVFAIEAAGGEEEVTSTLPFNSGTKTSPYVNNGVTWTFSGVTFLNSGTNAGMPNGAVVTFTLPSEAIKTKNVTATKTQSWSTSKVSIALTDASDNEISTFNDAFSYNFTNENNFSSAYTLKATNTDSKTAWISKLTVTYAVVGTITTGYTTSLNETVAISAAGLATYASDFALDYTDVEGIEAYIAKEEEGTVKLHQVKKVPAGTGVLLRSTNKETSYEVPITTAATEDVSENIFVRGTGVTVASQVGDKYNYILNIVDEVLGFYKANGNMVATNRAYLQTSVASARIALDFDDETTGIKSLTPTLSEGEGAVYDMQGRKVDAPKKGLYIINGRKVVIK